MLLRSPLLVLLAASFLAPMLAAAQGFASFSGRNHPELDWQVAETDHFRIMYPARLAGIEAQVASIAEASYAVLSQNLGVTFDDKIRIYLSDEDEITNGFAVPLGTGFTNIWVHQNDVAQTWTGREKWLRKVIAHELAHIFHYRGVRTPLGNLGTALGDPLPRFWTEGLAQYQTEYWDAYRGDRWLRTAVLDDALSYQDGRSIWNGRLLYAVGNAQVRYFAQQYGDSTLNRLFAHRDTSLFGLVQTHNFYNAFEDVTGESYADFYDEWRRDVNVYYNTLAGQMQPFDSLGTDPLELPGTYLFDAQPSPDTTRTAVFALTSIERPVRRLYVVDHSTKAARIVAEGAINAPIAWSPDGQRIAYSAGTRGAYGSILNDLFVVDADGSNRRQLTQSRRAAAPTFAPDGQRLAFIGSSGGTANVFVLDLATGTETQVSDFTGDLQLGSLRWHPADDVLALARFAPNGTRDLLLLDVPTGDYTSITDGTHDDRLPVWSPDGTQLAYTSYRDDVPNVFVYDRAAQTHDRVTYLALGAQAHAWLPPDSAFAQGQLLLLAGATKSGDRAYRIDAALRAPMLQPSVPAPYAAWTTHRPPATLPDQIAADASLITTRSRYRPLRNLTHAVSIGAPYVSSADDWGIFGLTTWIEPLGKHLFSAAGGISIPTFASNSYGVVTYVNNTWYPSVALSLYRITAASQFYGSGGTDFFAETYTGGDVVVDWPLDWRVRPYTSTRFSARLRYADIEPLDFEAFTPGLGLPAPAAGQVADLRFSLRRITQRPYRYNTIHPLDGHGIRLQVVGSARVLGSDVAYLRGDLSSYAVLPSLGTQRLFVYVRAQAQTGDTLPQNYLGLSRYDLPQVTLPGAGDLLDVYRNERVRGFRSYAIGNRVLFGTAEYRVLLLPSLQTRILGLVDFGATSFAAFADGGLVWTDTAFDQRTERLGLGGEIKNTLRIAGIVEIAHALGLAQPSTVLFDTDTYDLYYRLRLAVPF